MSVTPYVPGEAYQGRASEAERLRHLETKTAKLNEEIHRLQRRIKTMELGYVQLIEQARLVSEGIVILSDAARTHAAAARQRLDALERDVAGEPHG